MAQENYKVFQRQLLNKDHIYWLASKDKDQQLNVTDHFSIAG